MQVIKSIEPTDFQQINSSDQVNYVRQLIIEDDSNADVYFCLLNADISRYVKIELIKLRCGNPYRDGSILRMLENLVSLNQINQQESAELAEYAITSVKELDNINIARQRFRQLENFLTEEQRGRLNSLITHYKNQVNLKNSFGFN